MTDHRADALIDDALEALARPEPRADHVALVLSGTGPACRGGAASPSRPSAPFRYALPIAASLLVAASVTWVRRAPTLPPLVADHAGRVTDGSSADEADRSESHPYQPWGALREIDRPVLPPQAYWGMDAFEEWRQLGRSAEAAGRQPVIGNRQLTSPRPPREDAAAGPLAWAPAPSGLPPIELEPIAPAPLAFEPLADPAPLDLPAITLEPIVIAPLDEQEKP